MQLVEFFGIEKSPEEVGLLFRVREKNYTFIWDTCELVPDCLYFIYFKEQGQVREVSQFTDLIFDSIAIYKAKKTNTKRLRLHQASLKLLFANSHAMKN